MKDSRRGFIGRLAGWLGAAAAAPAAGDYLAAPPALAPPITQRAPVPTLEGMPLMPGTYCYSSFGGRPLTFMHDGGYLGPGSNTPPQLPGPEVRRGGFGGLHLHEGEDREGFF